MKADREVIRFPGVDEAIKNLNVPLSAAVRSGDFIFVAGQAPIDPKTGRMVNSSVVDQTRQVLDNLKVLLEHAGSSLDLVLKTTVYVTNAGYFSAINEVYRSYFPKDPPARTFVTVGSWPLEFDVEIECVAVVRPEHQRK